MKINWWPTKKLGEVAEIRMGETLIKKDLTGDGAPVYSADSLEKPWGFTSKNKLKFTKGAIIVGARGTLGSLKLPSDPQFTSTQTTIIIKPRQEIVNSSFLFYYLKTINLKDFRGGSGIPMLTVNLLNNLKIFFPHLPIQQKIVYILDTIQEAINLQEKIIEKTKELKKSMMADLFKYGGPSFRKGRKLKKTEIGEIPEDWEVVRLGEIVRIFDNKRIPLSEEQRQKMKGEYPYCGANGIIDYINDYIFDGEYLLLAEDGGYWGPFQQSAYIMKEKFWVNNHAHVFRSLKEKAENFYLMNVLNYMDLSNYIGGATRGKLNQAIMKQILLHLPSPPEQREIAEILQTIDQKIELEEKKKALYEELFKAMLNKLMSGEIDVENINF